MTPHLGWYVHHHGHGHVTRARTILPQLRTPATVLTSADRTGWPVPVVSLPLDLPSGTEATPPAPANVPLPDVLHYARIGVPGLRERVAKLTDWIARTAPSLLVVDVSVEVVLLARVAGIPVVTFRQHGDRRDPARRAAYAASTALLAPWPEHLEDPTVDLDVRARTWYVGGFSRFDDRRVGPRPVREEGRREVVVLHGAGGAGIAPADVAAAAPRTPGWRWTVLGGPDTASAPPSSGGTVMWRGWVADPFTDLVHADVVIATAGHNTVMECAAAAARLVVLAEDRPFDEQHAKARLLADADAAVHLPAWPAPHAWRDVLAHACRLDASVLAGLVDGDGVRRTSRRLDDLVAEITGSVA